MCTTICTVFMCFHPNAKGPTVEKQTTHCERWVPGETTTRAHCGSHRVVKKMVRRKRAKCIAERDQEVVAAYTQITLDGGAAKPGEKMGGQGKDKAAK